MSRDPNTMRLVTWNVAGRRKALAAQLDEVLRLDVDVVALQEVVAASLDAWRNGLTAAGYDVVTSDPDLLEVPAPTLPHRPDRGPRQRKNLNLIASKRPHRIERLSGATLPDPAQAYPERHLVARVELDGSAVDVHNVHTPPGSRVRMLKVHFWEAMRERLDDPTDAARILCGDFNSPYHEDDEGFGDLGKQRYRVDRDRWRAAELGFLDHPEMRDVYRTHHQAGQPFAASYIRKRSNARCRYDHVFVSPEFDLDRCTCEYLERLMTKPASMRGDSQNTGLSDHAPALATLSLR